MIFALLVVVLVSGNSLAGLNEGGVLIVSANESLTYGSGNEYCDESGLVACEAADTRVDGSDIRVFHVLAAFPGSSSPEVAAMYFGITYDPNVTLIDYGACSFEMQSAEWPGSGTGTGLGFYPDYQTDHVFEVYWFAGYVNAGGSGHFSASPHPDGAIGGIFIAPDVPGTIDEIADYGRLGFGADGYLPCPDPTPVEDESWGAIKARFRH